MSNDTSDTSGDSKSGGNALWGGRYAVGPGAIMREIDASIGFDRKMWRQDIRGSLPMPPCWPMWGYLRRGRGLPSATGWGRSARRSSRRLRLVQALEDIHMNIEARLTERIGEAGKRLHTGRSRNDQVALDVRLWVRDAIDGLDAQLADVMRALVARAGEHAATVMPGFTHLQPAQPTTLGHHLLAYVEMLSRDRGRLADCRRRLNESPLGAAALCGTGFPIDGT